MTATRAAKAARLLAIATASVTFTGCMVGPNYSKPAVPVPPAFSEPVAQGTAPAPAAWWTVFHDPTLTALEEQALTANLDIGVAVARIDQADATRRIQRSYLAPTISAQPSANRTREAQDRPNNGYNGGGTSTIYSEEQAQLAIDWEPDVWGSIRRNVRASAENEQATQDDLRFVRLSVTTAVANEYFILREADAETRIVKTTLTEIQRGFDITDNQFKRGLISKLAVEQSKAIVDQTQAHIQSLGVQRDQAEHAIAVLLGRTASGFSVADIEKLEAPPTIPAGMPAGVLARRPDVASAERSAAATSEQIGIAKAAYYPQFSLTGFAGYESTNPAALFNWQNTIVSLVGSATAPIFTNGRLKAGVDAAKANYRGAVLTYEKSVLMAYQQVEDQLAAIHYFAGEHDAEASATEDAQRAEQIAQNQYQAGLVSYLDVVVAQQTLLASEETQVQVRGQQLTSAVGLIGALGGGW